MEYKFRSQHDDPVNGNDLCHNSFGKNAERRHKEFKNLFAVQDPMLPIPPRHLSPNFKVDHFFSHILKVSSDAFEAGKHLSADEQDASFQGRHEDKQRVTYKKAGDGFLIDSICEDGYTMNFYPRNLPPPKYWIDKGYSLAHSRILFMLDALKDKHHTCGMDNLFISTKFVRGAFSECRSKVMAHGVCCTSGRGLPSCVIQENVNQNEVLANLAQGTTKAAVLKGDSNCENLVAFSVYDSKPVHFLTMVADRQVWEKNMKIVFNKATKKKAKLH